MNSGSGALSVDAPSGAAPMTAEFTIDASSVAGAGQYVTMDFGDGVVTKRLCGAGGDACSTIFHVEHVYSYGGTFYATLVEHNIDSTTLVIGNIPITVSEGTSGSQNPASCTGSTTWQEICLVGGGMCKFGCYTSSTVPAGYQLGGLGKG